MPKLFASDFDGTIHNFGESEEYIVDPVNTAAIRAFQEQGGLFGVCTGRPLLGLTSQIDDAPGLGFSFDFYITTTGAALFDRDRQLIWNHTIDRALAEEVYRGFGQFAAPGSDPLICAANGYWVLGGKHPFPYLRSAQSFDEVEGPFYGYAMNTATIEGAQEAAAQINERYAGELTAYVNLDSIDVVPAGCSKGTGLKRIAEHYGATLCGGMGDSFNDLALLDAADVSYTFHSSDAEVRAHADLLVSHASEALEDFARR